jgi:small subunit ribosomal protein S21
LIRVTQNKNESFESLLRRFNNAVTQDGILKEFKDKSVYDKPSVKKRRKIKEKMLERSLK